MRRAVDTRPLIAHVVYRFAIGGLENIVASLINGLASEAYRHAVISLTDITDFRDRIVRSDMEYVALHKGAGHAFKLYPRLFEYFRRMHPAVVHTCNLAALEAVVPACAARVPLRIHAEHGFDQGDIDGSSQKFRLLRRAYRPFVHHYVAVSEPLVRYLTTAVGVSRQHVSLIPNGVDLERFTTAGDSGIAGFPFDVNDHWVVGTVGRMQYVKNQTLLARAFIRALQIERRAADTLRLVMIGDGPLRGEAQRLLARAGLAHLAWLPGAVEDIPAVMRRTNCFVLPSLTEGTSCTIQEAMASGLPVIATAVGGNSDLVEHEKTGILVPTGDVEAMAGAMLSYWRDRNLAITHGAAGRRAARESFSLAAMVSAYDRLFSGLLAARQRPASLRAA